MKYSRLWPTDSPNRPNFAESFWGDGGIDRINAETGGWPHLVQLAAETAIDLVNDEAASEVTPALLERAFQRSIVRGHAVLYELMHRESFLPGEWDYVAGFRGNETQPPPDDPKLATSLRHRQLITEDPNHWRLRVPLMRRWLIERG